MVNHAYIAPKTPFLELEDDGWEREIAVNLTGYYALGQRIARAMKARGAGGSILFTASVSALGAGSGFAPVLRQKAGLVSLAQVMAIELAPRRHPRQLRQPRARATRRARRRPWGWPRWRSCGEASPAFRSAGW